MAIEFHGTQPQELLTALYGRGEIPFKLEYMGEGAYAWSRLAEAEEYDLGQNEFKLIRDSAKDIFAKIGRNKVNLLYLGCGTCFKATPLVKMAAKTHSPVNLCLLDISPTMIEVGKKKIMQRIKRNLLVETEVVDFEGGNFAHVTSSLRKRFYRNNLLFFFGNTFGNLADRMRILINFRESMAASDYLLIGVELVPNNNTELQNMLKRYRSEGVLAVFFNILKSLGVNRHAGKFTVSYNYLKNQVEWRFELLKDTAVRLGDEWVELRKGQKIFLGMSHKFTPAELKKLFKYAGFKVVLFAANKAKTYALIMGQPKEL
ncbi:MAG: L-histidine N(alpha)-methyltransferase [Candidatus Micrarchaeota archaeon]